MKIIIDNTMLENMSGQMFAAKAVAFLKTESDNGIVRVEPGENQVELTITDGFIHEILDAYMESFVTGLGMTLAYKAVLERSALRAKTIAERYLKKKES